MNQPLQEHETTEQRVLQANIELHGRTAKQYDAQNPHTGERNFRRVTKILTRLRDELAERFSTAPLSMLDVGCGTGFALRVGLPLFDQVTGMDITPEMLAEAVNVAQGATLTLGDCRTMPFPDKTFHLLTYVSMLHHLYDLPGALREARRVLIPGGVIFADQEPNKLFWEMLHARANGESESDFLRREHQFTVNVEQMYQQAYGVEAETLRMAEYHKEVHQGFHVAQLETLFQEAGFKNVRIGYEWYLGQGAILREAGEDASGVIEAYLRRGLPATASLFKYMFIIAR